MKPYVVSEIRNAKGQLVAQTMPQAKRRIISADTARTMTTLLEGVVTNGTGGKAAIPGYRVAGKTRHRAKGRSPQRQLFLHAAGGILSSGMFRRRIPAWQ